MKFLIITITTLLSLNLYANNLNLLCTVNSEIDQSSPAEDCGILLAAHIQVRKDSSLSRITLEDFPFSNDNETIFTQDNVAADLSGPTGIVYQLANGSVLTLPFGFFTENEFKGSLAGLKRFGQESLSLNCKFE